VALNGEASLTALESGRAAKGRVNRLTVKKNLMVRHAQRYFYRPCGAGIKTNIPDPGVLRFARYPGLFYFTLSA
jgi:hypothetical protein